MSAVRTALEGTLAAQDDAVEDIVSRVRVWHHNVASGRAEPLILVFTGSTGVGKTMSAEVIARAISTSDRAGVRGDAVLPEALTYITGSDLVHQGDLSTLRAGLRGRIAQALYECNGQAIVVLDEGQFVAKGVLDVLSPFLRNEASRMEYAQPASAGGQVIALDASRVIFILVSDIGQREVEAFMAAAAGKSGGGAASPGGRPSRAARQRLLKEMRWAISNRTLDAGVDMGAHAHAVIPFLPLTQTAVREVLEKRLLAWQPRSEYWHSVSWRNHADLAELMSDRAYTKYSYKQSRADAGPSTSARPHLASAASVDSSGGVRVDDGTVDEPAPPSFICARPVELHAVAEYGARALKEGHSGSALDRLYHRLLESLRPYGNASAPNPSTNTGSDASKQVIVQTTVLTALQRKHLLEQTKQQLSFNALLQRGAARVQSMFGAATEPTLGRSERVFRSRQEAVDTPVTDGNAWTTIVVDVSCTAWNDYLALAADAASAKRVLGVITLWRCRSIDRRIARTPEGAWVEPVAVQSCQRVYEGPL